MRLLQCITILSVLVHLIQSQDTSNNESFTFTGPTTCATLGVEGYDNITILNEDMLYEAYQIYNGKTEAKSEYRYKLCPNTAFLMPSNDYLTSALRPILNNTIIQCGDDASKTNNCVIDGGYIQLLFEQELHIKNVHIKGITFQRASGIAVAAWSASSSSVIFYDCVFRSHASSNVIEIKSTTSLTRRQLASLSTEEETFESSLFDSHTQRLKQSQSNISKFIKYLQIQTHLYRKLNTSDSSSTTKAMRVTDYNGVYSENNVTKGIIYSSEGLLHLYSTVFTNNQFATFGVGVTGGGHLLFHSMTKFVDNLSEFFMVYVSSNSFLMLNEIQQTSSNTAVRCSNGIFNEESGSTCLQESMNCRGICCTFGDASCIKNHGNTSISQTSQEASQSNSSSTSSTSTSSSIQDYTGPSQCKSDLNVKGYDDISTLNKDMLYEYERDYKNPKSEYRYKLCPMTTYTVEANNPLTVLQPVSNRTVIQCGNDGIYQNQCFIDGGNIQILFQSQRLIQNVHIKGLTFQNSKQASVAAWGSSDSSAIFSNCVFTQNKGTSVIEMVEKQSSISSSRSSGVLEKIHHTSKAMSIEDFRGQYTLNDVLEGVILNAGGRLDLYGSQFNRNTVKVFVVGNLVGAHLYVRSDAQFSKNSSPLFTVYVDNQSTLQINESSGPMSVLNNGTTCKNGIFMEVDAASCLKLNAYCGGSCCAFGDATCDAAQFNDELGASQASSSSNNSEIDQEYGPPCGNFCITAAVLVPFFALALVGALFYFVKVSYRNDPPMPQSPDDELTLESNVPTNTLT